MKRICLLCHMLVISQSRGKTNSVKPVRPLAHHKYSNELNQKDVYYSIHMVKFLHTVCLQIKCIFRKRDIFRNQDQGR